MPLSYSFSLVRKERRAFVGLTLMILAAMLLAAGCASAPKAKHRNVAFTSPALSPDGRLVAVRARVRGQPAIKLAVFDLETGSLRTFDGPPDQTWHNPSFSPSGDRLVFLRVCRFACTSGPKGFHIGIVDLETGRATTLTETPHLVRENPIFAPGGHFIVYGTRQVDDIDQRSFSKSVFNGVYGFYTRDVHALNLETGAENKIFPANKGKVYFMRTRPVGLLNERTLIIRGKNAIGGDLPEKLEQRVQNVGAIRGHSPEDEDYLYKVNFDKSFLAASGIPQAGEPVFLETDWVRPVSHMRIRPGPMVSFDTGLMAFVDRSERNRERCLFGCTREYDIFIGDRKGIYQATSFHKKNVGRDDFQVRKPCGISYRGRRPPLGVVVA